MFFFLKKIFLCYVFVGFFWNEKKMCTPLPGNNHLIIYSVSVSILTLLVPVCLITFLLIHISTNGSLME